MATEPDDPRGVDVGNPVLREGFTIIPNIILRRRDLSRDAKILYAALLSYAWQKDHCHPSYETLMGDLQCGRAQLSKYLKELKAAGLVEIKRRGLGQTSMYYLPDRLQPQEFRNETSAGSASPAAEVSKRNPKKTQEKDSVEKDSSKLRKADDQEIRNRLEPYVADFRRQFRDAAPLSASLTRLAALYAASGRSLDVFVAAMYQAREQTLSATKVERRMAYWFECLGQLVGQERDTSGAKGDR